MQEQTLVKLSKRISYLLRHHPEAGGLELDPHGWVAVDDLLVALSGKAPVTRDMLDEVVARNNKRRFAYDPAGTRIRASQGHSVSVDLALEPLPPPQVLFHGTVADFLPSILAEGLRPMRRHHVHLSPDESTARNVGARRGKPVVLQIDSAAMTRAGHVFYCSQNGVWLTGAVPPEYLNPDNHGAIPGCPTDSHPTKG